MKKIFGEMPPRAVLTVFGSGKRANQRQPIRAGGIIGARVRRRGGTLPANFGSNYFGLGSARQEVARRKIPTRNFRSDSDPLLQQIVDGFRGGLSAPPLHHLA